ncbi:MAG: hypothetical protein ACTSQI_08635 [Candidatus Helarchaeota archaeon]
MKINVIQIIFIVICAAVTIYYTYATAHLIATGQNVIPCPACAGGEKTLGFLDYGMIQFYIFMSVIAFLLYMLGGSGQSA